MEQEYIDALVSHLNTLQPIEQVKLVNQVWNCYRQHEKLAYALVCACSYTEHDFPRGTFDHE